MFFSWGRCSVFFIPRGLVLVLVVEEIHDKQLKSHTGQQPEPTRPRLPSTAPTTPPVAMRNAASTPHLASVALESLINTLMNNVIRPSHTPARATATRFAIVTIIIPVDCDMVQYQTMIAKGSTGRR